MLCVCKSHIVLHYICCVLLVTTCPELDHPVDGNVECSLGPDGVPTEGDTCVYQCDDGFIVSGNKSRECQSDGTWSGNEATCERCKPIMNMRDKN